MDQIGSVQMFVRIYTRATARFDRAVAEKG